MIASVLIRIVVPVIGFIFCFGSVEREGVIKRADFLMGDMAFRDLQACQVMESDVISCRKHASWHYMAAIMTQRGFASMLIVDEENRLLGTVTEDDLLMLLLAGKDIEGVKAEEIMTTDLPTATGDAPVHAIMDMMRTRRMHLIPVVKNEKLTGLVTRRDMITAYLNSLAEPPKTL